ncbi:hypothetical protein [Bradyrhizobium sp. CCBAU 51745]|uniref:hypothetical protein n=1 Tax=Bradyrhizobium sp. CCBAU 51745 TaxID=1325099 RepID=UPI002306A193|nr:hypothetical protein [Bradyrhizobium sp. CCBAU 51745]
MISAFPKAMKQKSGSVSRPSAKGHSAADPPAVFGEEVICIVLEGLRGEDSISELCAEKALLLTATMNQKSSFRLAGPDSEQGYSEYGADPLTAARAVSESTSDLAIAKTGSEGEVR